MVDVEVTDPLTGNTVTVPCEIDTGNPYSLAIPDSYNDEFEMFAGNYQAGGAGKPGEAYIANISKIGSTDCDHQTTIYLILDSASHDYGLIGVELLAYCETLIHEGPDDPILELELKHIPS